MKLCLPPATAPIAISAASMTTTVSRDPLVTGLNARSAATATASGTPRLKIPRICP